MAVRSDQLGPRREVAAGVFGLGVFVVPAGETWLVKRATSSATSAVAAQMFVGVYPAGSAVQHPLHRADIPSGFGTDDHETWWALGPGDTLAVGNAGPGAGSFIAYGAKLAGAA